MKKLVVFPTAVLLCLTLLAWADPSPMLRVGRVIDIDGPLLMTNRMTENSWYQGYREMDTFHRERLKADPKTSATLEFNIGGRAVISPGTEVEIVSTESVKVVEVKSGTFWAKFDKQQDEIQIKTAGGVMGIEGTEFFVEAEDDGETSLTVGEGQVRIESGDDEQVVTGGEEAAFRRGVKRFRRYADSGLSLRERRLAAFNQLRRVDKRFQHLILTRGLQKWRNNHLSGRILDSGTYQRRSPRRDSTRRRPPRRNQDGFEIRALEQDGGRPSASWSGSPGRSFAVTISTDEEAEDVVWFDLVQGTDFRYPSYGPELEAAREYYLSVVPLKADETPFQGKSNEIVSAQTVFEAAGHRPIYGELSGLQVEGESLPEIWWMPDEAADGYLVKILDGGRPVWIDEVKASRYQYPLAARTLDPGNYTVVIESLDKSGVKMAESQAVDFATQGWEARGVEGPPRD